MEDSARLVCALHGRSLRAICAVSQRPYEELSEAARDPSLGLSSRVRRRLMQIDKAFRLLRLVTSVSVDEFVNALVDELCECDDVVRTRESLNKQLECREAPAEAASAAAENEEQRTLPNLFVERHTPQERRRLRRLLRLRDTDAREKDADANEKDDVDGVDDELYGDGVDDAKRSGAGASSSTTAIVADAVHDDGGAVPQDADAAAGAQGPVDAANKKRRRKGPKPKPADREEDDLMAEAASAAAEEAAQMQSLLALFRRPKCPQQRHSLGAPRVSMCEARRCGVCGAEATVGMDCVGCDFAICFECVRSAERGEYDDGATSS